MKKSIFTKYLPFVAAVLLAASCSKDNGGDSIISQPSSIEESAQTLDVSNTVVIPFSVRVSSGASLSKIYYTDKDDEVVDKVVEREFEPGDCGTIQLSVSGDGATALLDLKSKTEGGKTIYYFDGTVNVVPGKEDAFKNGGIDLVGTFTTNSESTTCYSTTSLLDLERNVCKHVYKAVFKSDATSITFVDQNAYLCFTVHEMQTKFRLSFNGGEAQDFTPDATSHKIWIAVPCGGDGKPTVKGTLISEDGMDLECGTVYDVDRHDKYGEDGVFFVDLGTNDGKWWAETNIGATNPWDYGDYYAWGETETKDEYTLYAYKYAIGEYRPFTKYCNDAGWGYNGYSDDFTILGAYEVDGEIVDDDVAHVKNSNWSMPTKEDFENLINSCYWVWTQDYNGSGVKGYIVYKVKDAAHAGKVKYVQSGDDYTSSYTNLTTDTHIFIPAAGYYNEDGLSDTEVSVRYWSSSLDDTRRAFTLYFSYVYKYGLCGKQRDYGQSVRPVRIMN